MSSATRAPPIPPVAPKTTWVESTAIGSRL
jgi:hypothetical protein